MDCIPCGVKSHLYARLHGKFLERKGKMTIDDITQTLCWLIIDNVFVTNIINVGIYLGTQTRKLRMVFIVIGKKNQFHGDLRLTISDRNRYRFLATRFGDLWKATGWKVSLWVHWTCRHSTAFVDLHHSIYLFSSIPTERRNVEFKLDVTHCYKGWKISRPYACTFGFAHVLDLSALDVGLFLYMARRRGQKRGSMEEDDN
jgi:hypothetical protein